jgi:hypothetical protein
MADETPMADEDPIDVQSAQEAPSAEGGVWAVLRFIACTAVVVMCLVMIASIVAVRN